ncbi:hypothetical protein B4P00_00200 [Shewanella xiamenensis]|uniref:glycosyltransferase family 4 protein n=1 Tax=Shewanella xiamenensis TaxID=332186 RepID=UPI001C4DE48C|nr:glycosyltransferase family 1 protein [Shewanella xiamenensis]MBW0294687.1 hypothetical protein [Shewanella xiamenensis]
MLVLDSIIFSLQKAGGISVYFSEILKRLQLDKLSYSVIAYKNDSKVLEEYQLSNLFPIKSHVFPLSIIRFLDVYIPSGCKVFHSSYYRLPFFYQRKNVKIVTTVHDFTYERYIGGLSTFIHHWHKKRAILSSDVIVCISDNTRKDLLHFIPEAATKDVRVIYNGVSDSFYPQTSSKNIKSTDKSSIIFIGSRSGYKNFKTLVLTMKRLVDKNLLIVGGGALTDAEYTLLENNCPERYRHLAYVSNTQLNAIYNGAFCLVYPSLYEGFGIPAVEAMKAGCPVIAANSSSLPEVCGGAAILLDIVNVNNIFEAVQSLKDVNYRQNLIFLGLANSKRFSWDKMFQELKDIYIG